MQLYKYNDFLNEDVSEHVKSSIIYSGGKFKLLPQILHLFPNKISTFVDIFCGSLTMSINTKSNKTISNDRYSIMPYTKWHYKFISNLKKEKNIIINQNEDKNK